MLLVLTSVCMVKPASLRGQLSEPRGRHPRALSPSGPQPLIPDYQASDETPRPVRAELASVPSRPRRGNGTPSGLKWEEIAPTFQTSVEILPDPKLSDFNVVKTEINASFELNIEKEGLVVTTAYHQRATVCGA